MKAILLHSIRLLKDQGYLLGKFGDVQDCIHCKNIITDADPSENYSLAVRAYNKNGMGPISKLITFIPQVNIEVNNFNLDKVVDDIGRYKMCKKNN